MHTLTIYQNNDKRQAKTFTARSRDTLLAKLDAWLTKNEPDVCVEFGEVGYDGDPEPAFCLNYCESTRDWEWRESVSAVDILDAGTFAEMKILFIDYAKHNIETT